MSGESEIRLMVVAMLFSPIILLGMLAACHSMFGRMQEIDLDARHHHPRPAWSLHHRP